MSNKKADNLVQVPAEELKALVLAAQSLKTCCDRNREPNGIDRSRSAEASKALHSIGPFDPGPPPNLKPGPAPKPKPKPKGESKKG